MLPLIELMSVIDTYPPLTPPVNGGRTLPPRERGGRGGESIIITGLAVDSRKVEKGNLFFALKGQHADGGRFIAQAKASGAIAIVCDTDAEISENGLTIIRTDNARLAMARMAAKFYGKQPKHMVAVTGTDGKTSTADFFRQLCHHLGKSSASVGTLGILSGSGEILFPGTHTTPDAIGLHKMLAELASPPLSPPQAGGMKGGVDYVCMEASSHGLHQHRLDGVNLQAAAFTNLTRDHMDYHVTEEAYFAAKLRLFDSLLPTGMTAVLNQDDKRFSQIKAVCEQRKHKIIGFGKQGEQFRIERLQPLPHGQQVTLGLFGKSHTLEVPLVGAFQVMNILAALGLFVGTGGDIEQALKVIPQFSGVPGRLEQVVRLANGATVFIDYAHTPMALANILNTLRPHTQSRLHVVFGCGGDRDRGKRPEMGRIADQLADCTIVTDDNPRSENPALIRKAIMAATTHAKEVADRREAIYVALKNLAPGDVLVIAGKGHEKMQIIGDKTTPFDDAEVARQAAKELKLAA